MSVYVDQILDCLPNRNWKYKQSCHMFADTAAELHTFALSIYMRRAWAQVSDKGILHYDLTVGMRRKAVKNGAIEVDRHESVAIWNRIGRQEL